SFSYRSSFFLVLTSFYPCFAFLLFSDVAFLHDAATTVIYTLSLHDALPIWTGACGPARTTGCWPTCARGPWRPSRGSRRARRLPDRKSTRLNSSHVKISYAVFCLKKKK